MAEWFAAKLDRLSELTDLKAKEDVITEIKIKFANLRVNESAEVTRNLNLSKLFNQLTSNDIDVVEPICESLSIIFQASEPSEILTRYTPELYKLLSHNLPVVRIFALNEIHKIASNPGTLPQLLSKLDLLTIVTENVAEENISIAKQAMDILKKLSQSPEGLKLLYSGVLLRTIAKLLATTNIVKFRVYELIVDIATSSKECLNATSKSGFLQSLISTLDTDDILLQLNVLELMTKLAVTQECLDFLEEQGVLQNLAQKVAKANETPLSNLLIPGLMKFFGNVAQFSPNEIFYSYPEVISALFDVLESDDYIIWGIALDTLGHVSSTVKGKYALEELKDVMLSALKKIAHIIQNMPSPLRVRGLNNLVRILNVPKAEHDNRILSLVKSWFDALCEEPLKTIISLCKQPFADIRQASLEVLAVIASQEWGQEYIATYPGLVEFLLDRNVEFFKECKEVKFEIVKNLSESVPNIFDADTMQRFKKYVNEGPFYIDVVTEVAFENAA